MNLLDKQYYWRTGEKAELNLTKAENQTAALSKCKEFLKQTKYEKAKEHLDEVDSLESDIEEMWELFHKNSNQRSAVPPASPAQIKLFPELRLVFCLMMLLLGSYVSGLRSLKHTI